MKIWESTRKCPQLHREKFGEYVEWLFFERDPSQEPQMGILLSNSYSISVASCKEPLNDEQSLRLQDPRPVHTQSAPSLRMVRSIKTQTLISTERHVSHQAELVQCP